MDIRALTDRFKKKNQDNGKKRFPNTATNKTFEPMKSLGLGADPQSIINSIGAGDREIEKYRDMTTMRDIIDRENNIPVSGNVPVSTTPVKTGSGMSGTSVVGTGNIKDGILAGAMQYAIPGAKHGTRGNTDSLIVHRTAGHGFHPNDPRLVNDGLGAHLTITRDGKVHQVGGLGDKMWHAGPGYNNRSIGMEVAGKYANGAWEPMTDLQKAAVSKYGRMIIDNYGILPANIKHHASVAAKTKGEGLSVETLLRGLYN